MVVATLGTFDLFHYGHMNIIQWCRNIAGSDGKVHVFVNPDNFVLSFKGYRPTLSLEERMKMIGSIPLVDSVSENLYGDSRKSLDEIFDLDMIVIGSDWHGKDYLKQLGLTWEWLRDREVGICYVPYTEGISSSEIKKRINGTE